MDSSSDSNSRRESHHLDLSLLNMPWLITDYIMQKMELSDLMNLRLTCKTTKSWAEQRKYFQKMRIHIKSKASFQLLIKRSQTPTQWNNYYFQWTPSFSKHNKLLSEFSNIFGEHIHTLEFSSSLKKSENSSGIIDILLDCPNLKILIIRRIDSSALQRLSLQQRFHLSNVLKNLEQLGIFELLCHDEADADTFISLILSKCTSSLKSVAVPVIKFPKLSSLFIKYGAKSSASISTSNRATSSTPTVPTDVFVIRPMIQLLESDAPNLQTIAVVPESRSLLSDSALFCLSLLCYNKKIHLVYSAMSGVPLNLGSLNYNLSHHPTMAEIASKIMTVMASTTDLLLNYEFANLRELFVRFNSFHIEQDIFVVQHFPKLEILSLDFRTQEDSIDMDVKLRRMDMFIQGMLDIPRPSVNRLVIQNHDQVDTAILISIEKLVSTFFNVKELSLVHFNGTAEEFPILWDGLRLLEKVEVRNCPGLCDKGILGKNWMKPAILQLKYLNELTFSQTGRITDLSYIIAFRHMRLRRFYHEPLYPSDVTSAGYSSLADGDFHRFIRFLGGDGCGSKYFGCKTRAELKQYLEMFETLIEPDKKLMLMNFSRRKSLLSLIC